MIVNLKNLLKIAILVIFSGLGLRAYGQATINTIRIRSPRTKITDTAVLDTYTNNKDSVSVAYQYLDGLGRLVQTVQQQGSPTGRDMVQPVYYDPLGLESIKYLPYTDSSAHPGIYRPGALGNGKYTTGGQYQFYQQAGLGYVNTPVPYAVTVYDASPLNRQVEQGFAGQVWQLLNAGQGGHTVKTAYGSNDQSVFSPALLINNPGSRMVRLFATTINPDQSQVLIEQGTYNTGELYLTVMKDENWKADTSGCLSTTEEYKDLEGQVLCKRTYNQKDSVLEMLSTYYVYDDMGRLAFVLPPAAGPDTLTYITQTVLDNLCYQYRYDERGRLAQKKLPGRGWEYKVYNYIDQEVAAQDSMQRTRGEWTYTKFDGMGRTVITGLYNSDSTRAGLQAEADSAGTFWEAPLPGDPTGYTNVAWPTQPAAMLTTNFYDDYKSIPARPASYSKPDNAAICTTGLLTATLTSVFNNTPVPPGSPPVPDTAATIVTGPLMKVMYYDGLGRNIETYAQHYYNSTVDENNYDAVSSNYDFTNAVTATIRQHYNMDGDTGTPVITIANTYLYDHLGRKIKTWEQITRDSITLPRTLISQLDYNELGQVLTKHLHSTDSVNFLQNISYAYNERGWLLQSSAPLFAEQLQYNQTAGANGTSLTPQYNGNIAGEGWVNTLAADTSGYVYAYDNLNRLTSGISADGNFAERNIAYDQAGNIQALSRLYNRQLIDSLAYTYQGNQVQSITNNNIITSTVGYKTGTHGYSYDGNGNMAIDSAKQISISYNMLDLPQSLFTTIIGIQDPSRGHGHGGGGPVIVPLAPETYSYDADGNKLAFAYQSTAAGHPQIYTYYIDGIQYDTGPNTGGLSLSFIQTEEGRVLPYSADTANYYQYYLTDHLGNTRVAFDSPTGQGLTVEQLDDYLPFGLDVESIANYPANEYLYNKKELQQFTGVYDYGARFYDPVTARFTTVDPLAEKDRKWSPYSYGFDNSISFEDPDGMWPDWGEVGAFIASVSADLGQAANSLKHAANHPIETIRSLSKALDNNGAGIKKTAIHAIVKNTVKFATGNKLDKAAVFGTVTGEVIQLGLPEADIAKAGEAAKLGDLTHAEVKSIQGVVDQAERPLEVGGSAATGTRRKVGTDLPVGKGPGTKSDIDYLAPASSHPYFDGLMNQLPGLDPKTGIIPGSGNPYIGPYIRFEPNAKPTVVPKTN